MRRLDLLHGGRSGLLIMLAMPLLGMPPLAVAQTGDQSAPPPAGATPSASFEKSTHGPLDRHRGLMFGAALGVGNVNLSGTDGGAGKTGLATAFFVGWFLHRRVAVMYDLTLMPVGNFNSAYGAQSATNAAHALAIQVWPTSSFWAKFGFGYGHILFKTRENFRDSSTGSYTFALGYDVWHGSKDKVIDVQARLVYEAYGGNFLSRGRGPRL